QERACEAPLSVDTSKLALDECFIHVTPSPVLTDFKRPHNWVLGLMKVLPCVAIRRLIAATDVTARQTKPQMQPRRTDSQAIFAAIRARSYRSYRFQVRIDVTRVGPN